MKTLLHPFISPLLKASWGVAIALTISLLGPGQKAQAAEELVFTYGPLGRSIAISELEEFAETGEPSSSLRWYLRLANLDSEVFRAILTTEVPLSLRFLDRSLNSIPGEFALFQIGQVIDAGSGYTNIRALRSALVLSASENDRVSLLAFLQNYPLRQITIDGVSLARVSREVGTVVSDVERRLVTIVPVVQDILEGVICNCPPAVSPAEAEPEVLPAEPTIEEMGDPS
jgi:hypothetical protein